MTFFNNYPFNQLIENGHIYLAQPPLFKVTKSNKSIYIKNEKELDNFIIKNLEINTKKIKKGSPEYLKLIQDQRDKLSIQRFLFEWNTIRKGRRSYSTRIPCT